jgi:hypothetical protein
MPGGVLKGAPGRKPPKATTEPYTRHRLGIDSGVQSHPKATPKRHQGRGKGREHQFGGVAQNACSGSIFDNSPLALPAPAARSKFQSARHSVCLLSPFPAIASCNRVSTALILPQ